MVKKRVNKKQHGVVDLNKARPGVNETSRPVVPKQKIARPTVKDKTSRTTKSKDMPTVKSAKKIGSVENVKKYESKTKRTQTNKPQTNNENNGKLLITRRNLIFGAIGTGVLVAGASGIKFAKDTIDKNAGGTSTLSVPKANVINSDTLADNQDEFLKLETEVSLPYGSMAWANSSDVIAALIPGEKAKPLTTVDLIDINSGSRVNVLDSSIGQKEGYEIYDVRANNEGIIWTEVNILQSEWRIYVSSLNSSNKLNPTLVDKGGKDWETPTIAVSGSNAYWQVLPNINGENANILSSLKRVQMGYINIDKDKFSSSARTNDDVKNNPNVIYTSNGRMSTPVYPYKNGVVITPRAEQKSIFYQLTYINKDGEKLDSLMLPQNMKPLEAAYGNTGFIFCFDAIYNYGEGIANIGTYTPIEKNNSNYENLKWLNFSRNPTAAPAWCGDYLIVRSTAAVCVVKLSTMEYHVLDRPNASDDYGDYLASCDHCSKIVTYANIFEKPVSGEESKSCTLRIWS